jgi:hypothetical protein
MGKLGTAHTPLSASGRRGDGMGQPEPDHVLREIAPVQRELPRRRVIRGRLAVLEMPISPL